MCVRCSCKDIIEQQFEKSKAHSVEFSAKAAARRKPPCCGVWMSLQQLFLPQFLYAAGFVGIAVSFLHSGASRVLLVQVVPLVEYLRGAGTFLLVLFKRFCFFRPLGKEGTASLDIENELAVKQAIANLLKEKKTVVMIAHTLSIVKNADQILVVADGKIAESGTHEELLAKNGKYAAMWNAEQKISA